MGPKLMRDGAGVHRHHPVCARVTGSGAATRAGCPLGGVPALPGEGVSFSSHPWKQLRGCVRRLAPARVNLGRGELVRSRQGWVGALLRDQNSSSPPGWLGGAGYLGEEVIKGSHLGKINCNNHKSALAAGAGAEFMALETGIPVLSGTKP